MVKCKIPVVLIVSEAETSGSGGGILFIGVLLLSAAYKFREASTIAISGRLRMPDRGVGCASRPYMPLLVLASLMRRAFLAPTFSRSALNVKLADFDEFEVGALRAT